MNTLTSIFADVKYRSMKPSLVCSASIAASRIRLEMKEVWPNRLAAVTGYNEEDLFQIVTDLIKLVNNILN